jgi:cell division protein FtsN
MMRRQGGGTLLGFILGLLLGLGGALAVAVYVTKVPIPIVDRGLQRKSEQDVKEQERNKDWNPNAGLAAKNVPQVNPVTEPSTEAAAPPPAKTPALAPAPTETPTPPTANSKPSTNKDPIADLLQNQNAKAANKDQTVPEAENYIYFVQAGVFRTPEGAETQRAKLAMQGFDFKVSEREQAGQLVYRLRLGPYRNKADADQAHERLTGAGVEAALVRSQSPR